MFGVLRKIFEFAGSKKKLLMKAMVISFCGAVFAAMQFGALMFALDQVLSGQRAGMLSVIAILLVSVIGRILCFYYSVNEET
ncbi:MAG: ABC transporter ATP-binding protein, partial [Lachnospiraceae bacterium]|nr:ABC transporter ATP-binding protein [Lachnospiraceae bacterium]